MWGAYHMCFELKLKLMLKLMLKLKLKLMLMLKLKLKLKSNSKSRSWASAHTDQRPGNARASGLRAFFTARCRGYDGHVLAHW